MEHLNIQLPYPEYEYYTPPLRHWSFETSVIAIGSLVITSRIHVNSENSNHLTCERN